MKQTLSLIWRHFVSVSLANFKVSFRVKLIDVVLGRCCLLRVDAQRETVSLRLSPPQVILTELYSTGFQRSFSDEDDLTAIADSDVVYAFQAPPLGGHGSSTSSHSGSDLLPELPVLFRARAPALCSSLYVRLIPWLVSLVIVMMITFTPWTLGRGCSPTFSWLVAEVHGSVLRDAALRLTQAFISTSLSLQNAGWGLRCAHLFSALRLRRVILTRPVLACRSKGNLKYRSILEVQTNSCLEILFAFFHVGKFHHVHFGLDHMCFLRPDA